MTTTDTHTVTDEEIQAAREIVLGRIARHTRFGDYAASSADVANWHECGERGVGFLAVERAIRALIADGTVQEHGGLCGHIGFYATKTR